MEKKCFVCQSGKASLFLRTKERSLYKCRFCGLIFVCPQPKKQSLKRLYQKNYYKLQKKRGEIVGYKDYEKGRFLLAPYFRKKLKNIEKFTRGKKGKLLDVGCALGLFLEVAREKGWKVVGSDISPHAVKTVRNKGIKAVSGKLSQAKFRRETFDVITIFQTIEHDPDPIKLLLQINKLLKKGGLLLITTPNQKGLPYWILGKKWHGWRRKSHLFWLDKKSFLLILEKAGFKLIEIKRDDHIRGSFMDIFETLRRSYPSRLTKSFYKVVNCLPEDIKLRLEKIPQPPFGDLVVFARK